MTEKNDSPRNGGPTLPDSPAVPSAAPRGKRHPVAEYLKREAQAFDITADGSFPVGRTALLLLLFAASLYGLHEYVMQGNSLVSGLPVVVIFGYFALRPFFLWAVRHFRK